MRFWCGLVTALLCLLSTGAGAEVTKDARDKARIAYRRAVQSYDFGEFQKALDLFKEAYEQVDDPAILFNLAQCHRQLGQKSEAVSVYRSYLRKSPGARNAEEVRALMTRLEKAIAEEQAVRSSPPQEVPPILGAKGAAEETPSVGLPTSPTVVAAPIAPRRPLHRRAGFWGGLVGGVVVVGLVVGLAVAFTTPNNAAYPADTQMARF